MIVSVLFWAILLPETSHAAPTHIFSEPVFLFALIFLVLLALIVIILVSYDRSKLRRQVQEASDELHKLKSRFTGRQDYILEWSEYEKLQAGPGFAEWFGIEGQSSDVFSPDVLFSGAEVLSEAQYHELKARVDQLFLDHQPFILSIVSDRNFHNMIIHGVMITDEQSSSDQVHKARLWFRDMTMDERLMIEKSDRADKVKARSDRIEKLTSLMPLPFWIRNDDLDLVWVNQAYIDAVEGESRENVLENGLEIMTSSLGKGARNMAAEVAKIGKPMTEKHFIVVHGERRAMEFHNMPYVQENGERGYLGYVLDITELEQARGDLLHHTESHSETLNKLSTAVAIFGVDKKLEYYNDAFSRLWSLPESMLFGHPHHGEVLEALREGRRLPEQANFLEWKQKQLEAYTSLIEPVEEMWHLPDETTLRVVTQPHPKGGLLIFFEDVSDHLALERSYNTLFAVQQETLTNLHEGVAVFGVDGRMQLSNPGCADLLDLPQSFMDENPHVREVFAAMEEMVVNKDDLENMKTRILGEREDGYLPAIRIEKTNGRMIDFSAVSLPDGGVLSTFIDVTDSFRIENALRERNQALEETDKIKTEFLAHMSYELRNPLNSIIGFAELLQKEYQGPLNDDQHQYMNNILSASDHLRELINDILDLAVIEAGGMQLDLAEINVRDMLGQVCKGMEDRIRNKDLDVEIDCAEDLGNMVGDDRRIQHSIYNLLSNAVKFTSSPGHITIGARTDGHFVRIYVKDTGKGIPIADKEQIFEKFYTGSNVPKGQGAGLGMSLVKSFVELHGGSVEVDTAVNLGTTVTCVFPIGKLDQDMAPIRKQLVNE